MRRFLISLASAAVVAAAAPAVAVAGDRQIEVDAEVPFSAADLESAVALRTSETPPRIQVSPAPDADAVIVTVGGARRTVALGGLRGSAAARRVAVVSLDLFRQLPVPASPTTADEPVAVADVEVPDVASTPGGATESVVVAVSSRPRHPRAVFDLAGVYGLSGRGGAAHASFGVRGRLRGLVSAAFEIADGADDLRVTNIPIGAGVGWRWHRGALAAEAHARLIAAPHRIAIDDGTDRLGHTTVRFGAGALVSAGVRVAGPVYASVTGRLGAFLDRQRYVVGGREVFATSRADASLGVGISVIAGAMP